MIQSSNLKDFYDMQPTDYNSIFIEFNKPISENRFLINYEYLIKDYNKVPFSKDVWNMRPDFFCAEYYDHPFFYPVILLSNNLKTIFEFTHTKLKYNIIAPKIENVIMILSSYIHVY
jgi:hypothetical protein